MDLSYIHVHAMRIASGEEALIARVVTKDGRVGYGFSFRLDATEARHMAMKNAGFDMELPDYAPLLDHPWERAWMAGEEIEWQCEPGFTALEFLPPPPLGSSA